MKLLKSFPIPILVLITGLSIGTFSCGDEPLNPINESFLGAGKATKSQDHGGLCDPNRPKPKVSANPCLAITWDCGQDSTWTIFYDLNTRLQVHSDRILYSHYISKQERLEYLSVSEPTLVNRVRSGIERDENSCSLWSDAFQDPRKPFQIYKGEVNYLYRETKHARHTLVQGDQNYDIANIRDGRVIPRDFSRKALTERPEGLKNVRGRSYYLPVVGDIGLTFACVDAYEEFVSKEEA